MTDYTEKYLKYKEKYLQLKEQYGGVLNFGPTQTATYDPTASPSEFNLSSIRSEYPLSESPSRELNRKPTPTPKPTSTTKTVNYYYNHYLDPLYPRYIVSDYVVPYNRTPLYPPIFDVPVNTFDYYGEPKTTKRSSKRRTSRKKSKSKRKSKRRSSKRKSRR